MCMLYIVKFGSSGRCSKSCWCSSGSGVVAKVSERGRERVR
jgi:hypothetical protein